MPLARQATWLAKDGRQNNSEGIDGEEADDVLIGLYGNAINTCWIII